MDTPGASHATPLNRLALKIALPVTGVAAAMVIGGYALGMTVPPGAAAGGVLLLGVVTYGVAHAAFSRRMNAAREALQDIRQRRFERMAAVQPPPGDEFHELLRDIYRTGLTVEHELSEHERKENYRREFLGDVSHELRTPIFAIQGFAETLLDGALEDGRVNRAFLEKILRNTHRLGALTRDLIQISGFETGEFKMNPEPFNLRPLAREVAESLEPAARSKDVAFRLTMGDDLLPVLGDRERIRQVLVNLTDNAVKYTNSGGRVELAARQLPEGDVQIAVQDDGIGVAPEDIPRLTERFYRVDKSRSRDQGGTGLGLAIVKHILAAHHRSLHIESEPGRGSRFSFTLPVAKGRV